MRWLFLRIQIEKRSWTLCDRKGNLLFDHLTLVWYLQGDIVRFPWNQNFSKTWKRRQMVQKFPGKVSRNSGNCSISEMRTIQPKNSRFSGSKVEWRENLRENFFEILGIPRKAALFLEILKNAVAFAPESWRKFEPDVSVEWKPLVETKMKNPSLVPRRFWIGHSWTLPWAVTSPRDTRRELKPITGSLARSLPHFARTKDQERTPKDKAGKTHCLFARFRSFAAYLRARQTKPPATQALDWPCTVHINSSSATFFSISPVIHNAS